MHSVLTIELAIGSFVLGVAAAIPVGAAQVEVIRRALSGLVGPALMVMAGAMTADLAYACVAYFGVARFLEDETVAFAFWSATAVLLIALGIRTILRRRETANSSRHSNRRHNESFIERTGGSYLTGLTLGAMNPFVVAWWLAGARLLRDAGILRDFAGTTMSLVLTFAALGIIAYTTLLTIAINRAKRNFSNTTIRRITLAMGVLMVGFGLYFGVKSLALVL
jgi:threonine/homoserine/homoserine lactone efflux protein